MAPWILCAWTWTQQSQSQGSSGFVLLALVKVPVPPHTPFQAPDPPAPPSPPPPTPWRFAHKCQPHHPEGINRKNCCATVWDTVGHVQRVWFLCFQSLWWWWRWKWRWSYQGLWTGCEAQGVAASLGRVTAAFALAFHGKSIILCHNPSRMTGMCDRNNGQWTMMNWWS